MSLFESWSNDDFQLSITFVCPGLLSLSKFSCITSEAIFSEDFYYTGFFSILISLLYFVAGVVQRKLEMDNQVERVLCLNQFMSYFNLHNFYNPNLVVPFSNTGSW